MDPRIAHARPYRPPACASELVGMTTTQTQDQLPAVGRYRIDPARSTLHFGTRHLFGLAPVRGTFPIEAGDVAVREPVGGSTVQVRIAAAGFHTGNRQRDAAVRGPGFLDSDRFPAITFRGEGVELGPDGGTVSGTLTVHEVSRPVTVRLTRWEKARKAGTFVAHAEVRIDRRAFGITASRGMAGRYLDFQIEITCVPQ